MTGRFEALTQPAQHLDAVHARHLDVEDGDIRRRFRERGQRGRAVGIGTHGVALALEQDLQGGEDVLVVVDKGECSHALRTGPDLTVMNWSSQS